MSSMRASSLHNSIVSSSPRQCRQEVQSAVRMNAQVSRATQKPFASDLSNSCSSSSLNQIRPAKPSLHCRTLQKGRRLDTLVTNYAQVPDSLPFFGGEGIPENFGEDRKALFENGFMSHASCGPVECTSRGCRPVSETPGSSGRQVDVGMVGDVCQRGGQPLCSGCQGGCSGSLRQLAHAAGEPLPRVALEESQRQKKMTSTATFPVEFAEFVGDIWQHSDMADKYYQTAVMRRPFDVDVLIKYAEFSWQKMKDKNQAETFFGKALEEEPENASALASYALFLWESESS